LISQLPLQRHRPKNTPSIKGIQAIIDIKDFESLELSLYRRTTYLSFSASLFASPTEIAHSLAFLEIEILFELCQPSLEPPLQYGLKKHVYRPWFLPSAVSPQRWRQGWPLAWFASCSPVRMVPFSLEDSSSDWETAVAVSHKV
jgi:hypothetical protein